MGIFPKKLHSNIRAHKKTNIRIFKWGLMRKTLFLIITFLSQFLNKLMISSYTTMFYNNVTLYCKVLFWLKTCKPPQQQQQQQKNIKKHSRSSRANGKIKQTVPITIQNVDYIYSSQPMFIVFTLLNISVLNLVILHYWHTIFLFWYCAVALLQFVLLKALSFWDNQ